jgi:hypothetical protein
MQRNHLNQPFDLQDCKYFTVNLVSHFKPVLTFLKEGFSWEESFGQDPQPGRKPHFTIAKLSSYGFTHMSNMGWIELDRMLT